MPIDPRQLGPAQLCRLLNSTPLGEVINERQLYRHRSSAEFRIGDGKKINLFRYTAWLTKTRHIEKQQQQERNTAALTGYDAMKENARLRNARLSASGRNIGELPEVLNPDRKERARTSFQYFCDTYFPSTFHMAWSPDHLKVIAKFEEAVIQGGLFALAMPRGSGKTSLAECACHWAILYGYRDFVLLIGASEGHAEQMLSSITSELESNDLLLEDFPEAVYPIHCLDGIANRCAGQLYHGERTQIRWTAKEIILPTIAGSLASGKIIKVAGITGGIRGMKYKRADGKPVRPSLVILDDPQTDESARSLTQSHDRERIIAGAVLGLAGPDSKISAIMPCTVIAPGDMADRMLDREKHPQWQGQRTKMVYSFPTNEDLWQQYAQIRADSLRCEKGIAEATEFYRQNQEAMDAGCSIAWPDRFHTDEESAIQHAMNLKLQDEAAFFAEYQNDPLSEQTPDADLLTADQITQKLNGLERGVVPLACTHVTMFIDVQQNLLYYLVAAWDDKFTGYVIDYGSFPDQKRDYYTLRDARYTLQAVTHINGVEPSIYAGLQELCDQTLHRLWRRDDGAEMRIERCLIDANWGQSTEVVYQFCRQSEHANVLMPSHGKYVGAATSPMAEHTKAPGERMGLNWRIPALHSGKRSLRHMLFDTNFWKSFVQTRLTVPMGEPGCLSLFGRNPEQHRMLSEHLTAEYRVWTHGRGRTVDEWKSRPGQPDNHWLDGLVGAAVAASMQGASLLGEKEFGKERKKVTIPFSVLQDRARRR